MGKTSGGRPDAGVRALRINNRRESGVSWGRRGWGARGGARGPGSAGVAGAGRRRERGGQPRRPMDILTSIYALLSGGVPAENQRRGSLVCPCFAELVPFCHTLCLQGVNPKIDSVAFRLHCGATTAALLAASAALTTRHLVGNPIDCIHTRDIPEDVLNTYCWIHSTFTVAGEAAGGAYPGVRSAGSAPRRYGKYYQWVAFTLFFQVSYFLGLSHIILRLVKLCYVILTLGF
ncbi:Innexin shaking-B [Papilio machaon]|uniref:Innexin n=1 Tax=Papilio machaon TaxID=76193 RepID=A0A0N1PI77_PAPMA|nr:Innexin shaking-B [Papilio machaon]